MTRRQALHKVLNILKNQEQTDENIEIQNKINELINDLPITAWTKETIFDTFDQFLIDNNRNATIADISKRGLPPHPVIKHRFGITAKKFLDTYYPSKCDSRIYSYRTKEEWLKLFVSEYNRVKPSCAEEYNEKRQQGSPSWCTISRLYNITRWTEFQNFAALPIYKKDKSIKSPRLKDFTVIQHSDLENAYLDISRDEN